MCQVVRCHKSKDTTEINCIPSFSGWGDIKSRWIFRIDWLMHTKFVAILHIFISVKSMEFFVEYPKCGESLSHCFLTRCCYKLSSKGCPGHIVSSCSFQITAIQVKSSQMVLFDQKNSVLYFFTRTKILSFEQDVMACTRNLFFFFFGKVVIFWI